MNCAWFSNRKKNWLLSTTSKPKNTDSMISTFPYFARYISINVSQNRLTFSTSFLSQSKLLLVYLKFKILELLCECFISPPSGSVVRLQSCTNNLHAQDITESRELFRHVLYGCIFCVVRGNLSIHNLNLIKWIFFKI